MRRRDIIVYEAEETLAPEMDRYATAIAELSMIGAEPKSHTFEFLLNGAVGRRIMLDFGHPKA